ncbi:MAG: TetR/AcrR family transcriptional regulator [Anaerolineaceae bacterium]|nr:TetR/AcrR family transcriptional regulator [Anaerolineaceae bacterium]
MTMTAPKNDRRILRTRKLLEEALITLIQEKDYAEITIQDIADRADVNRVTFYLHYRDKQELLENSADTIFNDLMAKINPLTGENFRLDIPPESMTLVYSFIAENARFYRIVLGENGIPFLVNRLRKYLAELTIQRYQMVTSPDSKRPIPLEIVAQYAAGSIIGLISWWLENDMPIPPDQFAHQTLLLTAYGTYWSAGINPGKDEL